MEGVGMNRRRNGRPLQACERNSGTWNATAASAHLDVNVADRRVRQDDALARPVRVLGPHTQQLALGHLQKGRRMSHEVRQQGEVGQRYPVWVSGGPQAAASPMLVMEATTCNAADRAEYSIASGWHRETRLQTHTSKCTHHVEHRGQVLAMLP